MRRRAGTIALLALAGAALAVFFARLALGTVAPSDRDVPEERARLTGGDPERGLRVMRHYGCPSCHTIPGVPGADGTVGPALGDLVHRGAVAGRLANTPDNLVQWIRHPQAVAPGTIMPDMDVTERDARDMAAYLYTLDEP